MGYESPKISFLSKNLFSLFVALNVMGYDDENNPKGMSSVRLRVRKNLALYAIWKNKYPKLSNAIKTNHPWYLIKKVLNNKKNTAFFSKELQALFKEPLVQIEWKKFQFYEKKELVKINNSMINDEIKRFLSYFGKSNNGISKIKIILNPLDAYWRGYSIKIGDCGYVIVGPGMEKNHYELVRHELLHLFSYQFRIPTNIISVNKHKRAVIYGYSSSKIIRNEYIVKALNLLYERDVLKKDFQANLNKESKNFPYLKDVVEIIENR